MKPVEQGVQLERQKLLPCRISTGMGLDSATGMFARRTGVSPHSKAAAGARQVTWAGDTQQPRIQANQPAWGQTEQPGR